MLQEMAAVEAVLGGTQKVSTPHPSQNRVSKRELAAGLIGSIFTDSQDLKSVVGPCSDRKVLSQ